MNRNGNRTTTGNENRGETTQERQGRLEERRRSRGPVELSDMVGYHVTNLYVSDRRRINRTEGDRSDVVGDL